MGTPSERPFFASVVDFLIFVCHNAYMSNPKIKRVVVFGLGAAGSNFLLNIAHVHPEISLAGVDFDVVEQRNYTAGTQPYTKIDLNRPKVQALNRIILAATNKKVEGHAVKVTRTAQICQIAFGEMLPEESNNVLMVDAFDNAESRNLFLDIKGRHILHIGFSPTLNGEACWAESYSRMSPDTEGEFDVCQAHTARPFIQALTAIATLIATEFIDTGKKRSVYFDSKLKTFTF